MPESMTCPTCKTMTLILTRSIEPSRWACDCWAAPEDRRTPAETEGLSAPAPEEGCYYCQSPSKILSTLPNGRRICADCFYEQRDIAKG